MTYTNQTKSSTRITNYLRHGVVPVMGQLAPYEFVDPAFLDGTLISQINFTSFTLITWNDLTKSATSLTNLVRSVASKTWAQAVETWDQTVGTWDNPYAYANQTKSTTVLSNLTKH